MTADAIPINDYQSWGIHYPYKRLHLVGRWISGSKYCEKKCICPCNDLSLADSFSYSLCMVVLLARLDYKTRFDESLLVHATEYIMTGYRIQGQPLPPMQMVGHSPVNEIEECLEHVPRPASGRCKDRMVHMVWFACLIQWPALGEYRCNWRTVSIHCLEVWMFLPVEDSGVIALRSI